MLHRFARLRTLFRLPRFDGSTGRPRRTGAAVAGGLALALLLGSGIVVGAASASDAHVPKIKYTCEGVTVIATDYNSSKDNTAKVSIVGGETTTVVFGKSLEQFFPFPDSAQAWTFTASIDGWDGYDLEETHTSEPCTPPGILTLTAPACNVPGQLVDLTATFDHLVANRSYSLTLESNAPTSETVEYVPTQTTGSHTWPDVTPGLTYTLTITDKKTDLTASTSVTLIGCPDEAGISITPTECTAPGENGTFAVTAQGLVTGREYRIDIYNAGTDSIVDSYTFPATGPEETYKYPATPSGSYYATVTDTAEVDGVPVTSGTYKFLPCPDQPKPPTLIVTECNSISDVAAKAATGGRIQVEVTGLVPGRTYDIVVTDGSANVVLSELGYFAPSDTYTADLTGLPAGTYTASVTDVLVPGFTDTSSTTLLPCPTTDTTVELEGTTCTAPGDTADITATISNYAVGRAYTVTLTLDNVVVGTPQALDSSSGDPQLIVFSGLEPGKTYRVVVSDDLAEPAVTAAADFALAACPGDPDIAITPGECSILGATNIGIDLDKLVAGETYNVTIVTTATGDPVPGVPDQQVVASLPTLSLLFKGLPNGTAYTITVENVAQTLSATAAIFLEICDLPTFDLPTLAFTGSSPVPPTLAGLGLLQLGLVLLGVALIRRRSAARAS